MSKDQITDFHVHIYYDQSTLELAQRIGEEASQAYDLPLGRFHTKNVGPHPRWSVQLSVPKAIYGEVISWFCLNRQGLTIFTHPNTGQSLEDHRDRAIWMGECLELNLENF